MFFEMHKKLLYCVFSVFSVSAFANNLFPAFDFLVEQYAFELHQFSETEQTCNEFAVENVESVVKIIIDEIGENELANNLYEVQQVFGYIGAQQRYECTRVARASAINAEIELNRVVDFLLFNEDGFELSLSSSDVHNKLIGFGLSYDGEALDISLLTRPRFSELVLSDLINLEKLRQSMLSRSNEEFLVLLDNESLKVPFWSSDVLSALKDIL